MKLTDLISQNNIYLDLEVESKKTLFKFIANKISHLIKVDMNLILQKLNEREKLGTTSLGNGVAIPHTKIDGQEGVFALLLKLKRAIRFSNDDPKNVELVFVVIAPENEQTEHLLALSVISKFLKKKNIINRTCKAKNVGQIYNLIVQSSEER